MTETLENKCKRLEHFETPVWAVKAILDVETLGDHLIIDPCCGTGILANEAMDRGYQVQCVDINDWGYAPTILNDYLIDYNPPHKEHSVLMNPPFSKAVQFVEKSLSDGAEKVVCFQRFAWWESKVRRKFWEKNPPSKVYICGDRAASWRHDIPIEGRKSSSPTAHAWFIWDKGHSGKTELRHIWKS